MEEWKTIKGFEDYQVSNLGRVKSLRLGKERILKDCVNGRGYNIVGLSKDSRSKTKAVHQLVAIAFLNHTPCGNKFVIDHVNAVKTDNRLENLQIVTQRFNLLKRNRKLENFNTYKKQGVYHSVYKGVSWDNIALKWICKIKLNGKDKHLGLFTDELEASKAYQTALLTLKTQS